MDAERLIETLIDGRLPSLAAWYAEPLSAARAERLHVALMNGPQQPGFPLNLARVIVDYWTGRDERMTLDNLLATSRNDAELARIRLCYGQLLLARKLTRAWHYLDAGFVQAARLFGAEDYFVVLKRHQMLRNLVLSERPSQPLRLQALLDEAAIIRQLRRPGEGSEPAGFDRRDTLG